MSRLLYGVAIHDAIASGDLNRMKALAHEAEAFLEKHGDVRASLQALESEMARIDNGPNPVPPYGVAIHEAISSGDLNRMKAVAAEAEAWLKQRGNVSAALQALKNEIDRAG